MLNKLKKTNTEGFTIIEVMIVLAIAGLIILIVLLAVPALQRNGRNTAIKNDASAVAGGISEYESNNDGSSPTGVSGTTGTVAISGSGTATTAKTQGSTQVAVITSAPAAPTTAAPSPAVGTISVYLGHKCEDATGAFVVGSAGQANPRSAAIYYSVESASITQQKCIDA